ncbi:MAG: LmeA family phospholipid-binding protein [Actinophytocola sp.]|uniref:LmeA family phospholipid-binding protein n=1 Tax=Actinophytocola sp. TaxID=1872138 RepID=UPI003D6BD211
MTTMTEHPAPRTPPRRRRRTRRLVITLLVVIGLLVAADFGAAAVFEYQVSKRAREQFHLTDDPSVKVQGFSFLVQAISGEYGHVSIDAKGVPVQDTLRDLEVHVDLMGVQAPLGDLLSGSLKQVAVDQVEGQVRVRSSDVARAVQRNENPLISSISNLTIDPISESEALSDPDDRTDEEQAAAERADELEDDDDTKAGAKICATGDIGGEETDFCANGLIELVENAKAKFTPSRLEVNNSVLGSGELPEQFEAGILQMLTVTLDPGELPFTVTPTAVNVEPGVLSVEGKAFDVVLGGSGG